MNEEQVGAFNLAVELYTDLLFNQKELITKIIEVSYARGMQEGMLYAQRVAEQEYYAQAQEEAERVQVEEEEYVPKTKVPEKDINPFEIEHTHQPQYKPAQPTPEPRKISEQEMNALRQKSPAEELISKMKGVRR